MEAAVAKTRDRLPANTLMLAALGLVLVVAGAVRVTGLDRDSFWFDEAFTHQIVSSGFWHVLDKVPETEFTPPLYYVLAWAWGSVFGTDEVGLGSLSVLLGILTVAATYFAGKELVNGRTGVAAAALCAVNPLLVFYSQEARAYSLLALLSAVALVFLGRELRRPGDRVALGGWSLTAIAAMATHYFAVFLVVPQALWLLWRRRDRDVLAAVGAAGVAGAALLALAIAQKQTALLGFLEFTPLRARLENAVVGIAGGPYADNPADRFPIELALFGLAGVMVVVALATGRIAARERQGTLLAIGVAVLAAGVPLALAPLGFDYLATRNLVGVIPPLCVGLAAGLMAQGIVRVGAPLLAAIAIVSVLGIERLLTDEPLQRADWRTIEAVLGAQDPERVIVTHWSGQPTLEAQRDTTPVPQPSDSPSLMAREVWYVTPPLTPVEAPSPAFEADTPQVLEGQVLIRFTAARPTRVTLDDLTATVDGPAVIDVPDGDGRL